MNKTLLSIAPSITSLALQPSRQSTLKNKDNTIVDKSNRTSRSRDALSNITNNTISHITKESSQGGKITKKEKSKSTKQSSKRTGVTVDENTAAVTATATVGGGGGGEVKSKGSIDPMVIDESHDAFVLQSPPSVKDWEDIDANDGDDPQAVSEYVNEIYDNLKEKELRDRINPNYMSITQTDVNEKMRSILIDWLIEVHRMFKLLPETLFLCVNIIDRYLQQRTVTRDKLQLVGITSMLVASKYEEIFAPECNDFVYISDGAYTKEHILTMEQTILNVLAFDLTHPSSLHFLRRYSKAAGSDYTIHTLCKYIIEVMLIDVKLLKYTASQIAAGSVYVARAMTEKQPLWTPTLEHYSGYKEEVVRGVAGEMNEALKKWRNSSLKAIKKKYSTPKYGQVADIPIVDDLV
eukprot:TRINITY_DN21_c0_g1_i2.p1 TRINITY_DN21_c0_g1~~TRINITY_DN21_c0_g1_i2.p1  ORF type:complete len:408 (-),score=89.03 TRINITY_DN21_c0_g1_i2:199-1422(-)